ncbi:MAG: glycerol-3-phosphate 1-O-acyltransferase PlsY [Ignavibacteriae bacterium]|nr:glycerol-3-phosphate 1-O-acyltransferase PlsY [Ignavibacteriota bacterium]
MGELSLVIVLSYIVGSIPTSIIISKLTHGIDVRNHGSGNAGGTNVFRVLGWKYGVTVILLDIFKGYVATMLVTKLMLGPIPFDNVTPFEDLTVVRIIAGCAAILGHIWTIFASFRGGKGIATAGGVLLALATIEILVTLGVFIIVFAIWRYVSLGSVIAALSFPVTMAIRHNVFHAYLEGYNTLIFFSIGISLLLVYTHRTNIKRLIEGTENRLSSSSLLKRKKNGR